LAITDSMGNVLASATGQNFLRTTVTGGQACGGFEDYIIVLDGVAVASIRLQCGSC